MNWRTRGLVVATSATVGFFAARALAKRRIETFPFGHGIKIKKAVTIGNSAATLYSYWRKLRNIPALFNDALSVEVIDEKYSRWTVIAPGGFVLEWVAEITVDRRNEMIGWRSLEGADIDNAGYVRFEPASGDRGTVVRIALQFNPPGGKAGAAIVALFGVRPAARIEEALSRFKQTMEAKAAPALKDESWIPHSTEIVQLASEDSFPASDPPSWTGTTGP